VCRDVNCADVSVHFDVVELGVLLQRLQCRHVQVLRLMIVHRLANVIIIVIIIINIVSKNKVIIVSLQESQIQPVS